MNPISEQQAAIIKQAIEWYQRLEQGEMDPVARRKFGTWLRFPAHAKELARICLIYTLLKHAPFGGEARPHLPENVIDFQNYAPPPRPRVAQPSEAASVPRRLTARFAMAASVVVAVAVVGIVSLLTKDQTIVTREGSWEKQLLEDGTVVYAGPNTSLRFDLDGKTRAVTLVHGEALFEVAKDPRRPFIVATETGTVQALGTVFATADVGDEVVVTVASGKVAVTSPAAGAQPILPLAANQQVVLSSIGISEPVAVNAEREIKWIRNWYEYDGERVGEIVEQLNRRHEVNVIVDDPEVARLRMSALAFKPSEPEEFVTRVNQWYAASQRRGATNRQARSVLHLEQ